MLGCGGIAWRGLKPSRNAGLWGREEININAISCLGMGLCKAYVSIPFKTENSGKQSDEGRNKCVCVCVLECRSVRVFVSMCLCGFV